MWLFVQRLGLPMDGVEFVCLSCGCHVVICRRCWRGQRYCDKSCRLDASRASHRRAQSCYAKSALGKLSQSRRSRRFRLKKNATDAATNILPTALKPLPIQVSGHCVICGNVVGATYVLTKLRPGFSLRRWKRDYRRDSS